MSTVSEEGHNTSTPTFGCAPWKGGFFQWVQVHPATPPRNVPNSLGASGSMNSLSLRG